MAKDKVAVPKWVAGLKAPPQAKTKVTGIRDPPGFPSQAVTSSKKHGGGGGSSKDAKNQVAARKGPTAEEMDTLKLKKAWEAALAPAKSLPMTAVMMYMSGNSLQIFSIMMVFMAFKNPVVGLMGVGQVFERFQTDGNRVKMVLVKFVYVAMQLLALVFGLWKINSMGLLPTTRSDWLAWEARREPLEQAVVAL